MTGIIYYNESHTRFSHSRKYTAHGKWFIEKKPYGCMISQPLADSSGSWKINAMCMKRCEATSHDNAAGQFPTASSSKKNPDSVRPIWVFVSIRLLPAYSVKNSLNDLQ